MGRRRRTKVQRVINLIRRFIAFLFSHVGLCALVIGYSMLGAVVFQAIELPHELNVQREINKSRLEALKSMWKVAFEINFVDPEFFSATIMNESKTFRQKLMKAVKHGYDGKDTPENPQWTMSGAFLFSLTVITTIGYGHIAPRTYFGKAITIIYAIVGIPLMLLFLTNVGDILAKTFRFLYAKTSGIKIYSFQCRDKSGGALRRQGSLNSSRSRHSGGKMSYQSSQQGKQAMKTASKNSGNNELEKGSAKSLRQEQTFDSFEGVGAEIITMDDIRMEALAASERFEPVVEGDPASLKGSCKEVSDPKYDQIPVPISVILLVMAGYFVIGAATFSLWEKQWHFLDGVYFCYISLTTIGFGDLMPGNSLTNDAQAQQELVVCSLYLLFGMALIAMCFNLAQEEVVNKVTKIAIKLGMIKNDEEDDYQ